MPALFEVDRSHLANIHAEAEGDRPFTAYADLASPTSTQRQIALHW